MLHSFTYRATEAQLVAILEERGILKLKRRNVLHVIINAPTLFELATRQKLRFASPKGLLTVEDLWDLPMTGNTSLDSVSKLANRDVKVSAEESLSLMPPWLMTSPS